MLTNLVILVSSVLQTNVALSDNAIGCAICDGIAKHGWAVWHECSKPGRYQPATQKTETTTVLKVTTFSFDLEGRKYEFVDQQVVTNIVRRYELKQNWEVVNQPSR